MTFNAIAENSRSCRRRWSAIGQSSHESPDFWSLDLEAAARMLREEYVLM